MYDGAEFSYLFHDSGTGQTLISCVENFLSPIIFDRQNQTGIKTRNLSGLSKLTLTSSNKTKPQHICRLIPFYSSSCEISYCSLISLHSLLTI